jgi:hypothetical protein
MQLEQKATVIEITWNLRLSENRFEIILRIHLRPLSLSGSLNVYIKSTCGRGVDLDQAMGASITQERAGNASTASVASGKRLAKSKQLQVISRTRRHYCGDAKAVVLDFTNSKMRGSPAFAADRCNPATPRG